MDAEPADVTQDKREASGVLLVRHAQVPAAVSAVGLRSTSVLDECGSVIRLVEGEGGKPGLAANEGDGSDRPCCTDGQSRPQSACKIELH